MKKNERFVAYGGCYGLLLLAAFLLQLKWQGYICCSIVFVLVMWRMDKVLKEEKKQQTRLQETELYMEQMLYIVEHHHCHLEQEQICKIMI